ncbi:MAG: hypothetical protein ACP5QR_13070 [Rhizomicrobium sp.]
MGRQFAIGESLLFLGTPAPRAGEAEYDFIPSGTHARTICRSTPICRQRQRHASISGARISSARRAFLQDSFDLGRQLDGEKASPAESRSEDRFSSVADQDLLTPEIDFGIPQHGSSQ